MLAGIILLIGSLIVSILLSIWIGIWMIKRVPRIPHIIVYGLVSIGIIAYFVYVFVSGNAKYLFYDPLEGAWPILILIPTGILLFGIIKGKDFEKKWKYSLNLFFSGLSFWIIEFLILMALTYSTRNIGFTFGAYFLLPFLGITISIILAIIGLYKDRLNKQ